MCIERGKIESWKGEDDSRKYRTERAIRRQGISLSERQVPDYAAIFKRGRRFDDRRIFGKNSQRKNGLKRLRILRVSNIIEACKSAEAPKRYLWREQANIKKTMQLLRALKTSGGRGCIFVCPARTATKSRARA